MGASCAITSWGLSEWIPLFFLLLLVLKRRSFYIVRELHLVQSLAAHSSELPIPLL